MLLDALRTFSVAAHPFNFNRPRWRNW